MAKAQRPGGLYYVRGIAVDAEGNAIEDAPPMPADTPPQELAVLAASPEERIAFALASALGRGGLESVPPTQSAPVIGVDAGGATPPPTIPGRPSAEPNTTGQPGAGTFVPPGAKPEQE